MEKRETGQMGSVQPIRREMAGPFVVLASMIVAQLVAVSHAWSQDKAAPEKKASGRFEKRVFEDAAGAHHYQVFLPAGYDANRKYPVILYLHGADECGRNGVKPTEIGLGPFVRARAAEFPFIVVFPQCETIRGRRFLERWQSGAPDAERALKILDEVEKVYSVDRRREILTGWSMGGYGAWSLGAAHPQRWAAVVPVSGGGDVTRVAALKNVPVWAVHGPEDRIVFPQRSREMVKALTQAGGSVRFDEPDGEGHLVWRRVYDSQVLETWLGNPRGGLPAAGQTLVARGTRLPRELQEFVPAVDIAGAVYLRLGTPVIETIAASIPEVIPADLLNGTIEPIVVEEKARKIYEIRFDEITYKVELDAVELETLANGRVRARLALKNATVTIGETVVHKIDRKIKNGVVVKESRKFRAQTGPVEIQVAHGRSVVLEVQATPNVKDRKLRLKLEESALVIDEDQFDVLGPNLEGIRTKGLGVTPATIQRELRNGLYGRRELLSEQFQEMVVPRILAELEQQIDLAGSSDLFRSLWPLPVFQPRVRVWPEAVTIEKGGLSLAMGLTVAAADPSQAPKTPRQVVMVSDLVKKVPRTETMQVGFAPALLGPLTQMLIDADVARIDVRDAPELLVRGLGDRKSLAKVVPAVAGLPETTELRTELVLTRPVGVAPTGPSTSVARAPLRVHFEVPGAQLIVGTRTGGAEADWKPLAVFDVSLTHIATATLKPPMMDERQLKIDFSAAPKITMKGRFAAGATVKNRLLNTDVYRDQFETAWRAFAADALQATVAVTDFQFGAAKLRLRDIGWQPPLMYIEFSSLQKVTISNRSTQQVEFVTRRSGKPWSSPVRLAAGQTRRIPTRQPLTFRRLVDGVERLYTLKPGSRSEFRIPEPGQPPQLFRLPVLAPAGKPAKP